MKMMISLGLCLLALTAGGCHKKPTQPPPDNPPPPQVITYPRQFDPAWHPNDTMIIYYTPVPEVNDTLDSYTGLWAIRPDGSNNRPYLTKGMNPVYTVPSAPEWSPDGNWLVFSTGWETNIYKVKANGDSLTKLTFDGGNTYPNWSPDGSKIAYCVNLGDRSGIYTMVNDGSGINKVCNYMLCPVWLNDGLNIIAIMPMHGYVYKIIKINSITSDTTHIATISNCVDIRDVNISRDGSKIVFEMSLNNNTRTQIWSMNIDGSNLRQLTDYSTGECGSEPCWSQDGTKIVYSRWGYGSSNNGKIWIMNADGSNKHQLTP